MRGISPAMLDERSDLVTSGGSAADGFYTTGLRRKAPERFRQLATMKRCCDERGVQLKSWRPHPAMGQRLTAGLAN